jgi:hypothetical protein
VLLNSLEDIDKKDLSPEDLARCKYIFDTVFNGFNEVAKDYKEKRNVEDEIVILSQMNVHKYKENTWMGTHHDAQEGDTRLKYSMILYVNDDYEGGEISFCIRDGVLSNPDKEFPENTWNHMVKEFEKSDEYELQEVNKSNSASLNVVSKDLNLSQSSFSRAVR